MPPFILLFFSSVRRASNGDTFALPFFGNVASAGMFQVFPVRKAPSIFPVAQWFLAVRSLIPYFSAYWFTDIYSMLSASFCIKTHCKDTIICRYRQIIVVFFPNRNNRQEVFWFCSSFNHLLRSSIVTPIQEARSFDGVGCTYLLYAFFLG